jgi:uncharacterized membrane protein YoaK (UPF0700 family)
MKTEPAIILGAITTGVTAIIGLLVVFGIPLSEDQQKAILTVVAALAPIALGLITRRFVYSPATYETDTAPRRALVEDEELGK